MFNTRTSQPLTGEYKESSRGFGARAGSSNGNIDTSLIPQIVSMLWSNARLARDFAEKRGGWESNMAQALSATPADIKSAVSGFGREAIQTLVDNNPAGRPPASLKTGREEIQTFGTEYCPTSGSCPTSYCPTVSYCPT